MAKSKLLGKVIVTVKEVLVWECSGCGMANSIPTDFEPGSFKCSGCGEPHIVKK